MTHLALQPHAAPAGDAGRAPRGQILVMFALMLTALLGVLGLAVDGGVAFAQRRTVQNAADAAASGQHLPTHVVVVRPGTGEILAVSSNEVADAGNALNGRFPPGSSFKTVSATALLSTGTLTPDTAVPCPGTTTVEGREFENQDQFDLGTVPFTEAFAQSCNTTFIQQGLRLPDPALAEDAAGYGVGADWQLPVGICSGAVPADSSGTIKAANAVR